MAKLGIVDFIHFRFREDSGSETAAAWLASEDVNITFGGGVYNFRLRLVLEETTGTNDADLANLTLQFHHVDVGWNNVPSAGDYVRYQGTHGDLTDNEDTTQQLTDPPGSFITGEVQLDNTIDSVIITAGNHTELEYALQAGTSIDPGEVVTFRISRATGDFVNTVSPTLTRSGGGKSGKMTLLGVQ